MAVRDAVVPDLDLPTGGVPSTDLPSAAVPADDLPGPSDYRALARKHAIEAGIDPDLFERQIQAESSFNPRARSPVGAMGLGQLMPDTAKELGVKDPFNPDENLRGAARYMASRLKKYGGDYTKTLAAYNGGDGAVQYAQRHGTYRGYGKNETFNYLRTIMGDRFVDGHDTREADFRNQSETRPPGPPLLHSLQDAASNLNRPLFGTAQAAEAQVPASDLPAHVVPAHDLPSAQDLARKAQAIGNPMDQGSGVDPAAVQRVHSAINEIGGHQDITFILHNAQLRDGGEKSILELRKDPKSHVSQALALYAKDPAAAMDEYGLGSPAQNAYMAQHFPGTGEGKFADFMAHHPKTNAAVSMLEEFANPVAWLEGGAAGKLLGAASKVAGVQHAGQAAARAVGLGSPLAELGERAGTEGSQWAKGLIASVKLEDQHADKAMQQFFGGLTNDQQREVVRLSQGLKPDPRFFAQSGDLMRRASALRSDIGHVTGEQIRVGRLKPSKYVNGKLVPGNVYDQTLYFPMSKSKELTDREELFQTLRGTPGTAGAGDTSRMQKKLSTLDEWQRAGILDKDFSPAENYATWRRQRMQHVAFEDAMKRAPTDLVIPSTPASRQALSQGGGTIGGKEYVRASDVVPNANEALRSPAVRRSLMAPELWKFYAENGQFAKYVDHAGSQLPGEQNSWAGRFVSIFRNSVVSNPIFHPGINVAGNDAAARGMHGLGGPIWEVGGHGYNTAKAVALQAGLAKPEQFVGGAKQYASWMDRALKAGGLAEFGTSRTTALGGDRARLMTEPATGNTPKAWLRRLDKSITKYTDWNMERTFGDKGEAAFAVSLFKDAVEKGKMSDADAGRVVRESLGDYYNFDPKSPYSSAFMFMPWLKGNVKFWTNVLVRRPQYVTSPQHAIRNYNLQQGDPAMDGPFAPPDWRIFMGSGGPAGDQPQYLTPPFVGRDISKVANIGQGVAQGDPLKVSYNIDALLEGRANPLARNAVDTLYSLIASKFNVVTGPETDFHMVYNPKAPPKVRRGQVVKYLVGHDLPVPLLGYAMQDAMRRGMDAHDLATALMTAAGAGYGSEGMSDRALRVVSKAKRRYLKAYDVWQYDDHDDAALQESWDQYIDDLKGAGVIR